jgi:hypothetical protein
VSQTNKQTNELSTKYSNRLVRHHSTTQFVPVHFLTVFFLENPSKNFILPRLPGDPLRAIRTIFSGIFSFVGSIFFFSKCTCQEMSTNKIFIEILGRNVKMSMKL